MNSCDVFLQVNTKCLQIILGGAGKQGKSLHSLGGDSGWFKEYRPTQQVTATECLIM